jgi:hypothetical protein
MEASLTIPKRTFSFPDLGLALMIPLFLAFFTFLLKVESNLADNIEHQVT